MTSEVRSPRSHSNRRSRWLKLIVGIVVAAIVGWLTYATVHILAPAQGQLQKSTDAVVSLAPQPDRLPLAQQQIDNGNAETLVVSYFDHDPLNYSTDTSDAPLKDYCNSEASYTIICFTPEENATIGEAYEIASLAKEHSWKSLTIATDTTHAFRTRFIFEQCLGDEVDLNVVIAYTDLTPWERIWQAAYENAAFWKAAWQTTLRC